MTTNTSDYFVVARTFAAPFTSETIERYVTAGSPAEALESLVEEYKNGIGIFAAAAYGTADDYHRSRPSLVRWMSNKALAVEGATMIYSESPEKVEVDGKLVTIDDPKAGRIV